jgi:hypothetical protein
VACRTGFIWWIPESVSVLRLKSDKWEFSQTLALVRAEDEVTDASIIAAQMVMRSSNCRGKSRQLDFRQR